MFNRARFLPLIALTAVALLHDPARSQVQYKNGLFSATAPFQLAPKWNCNQQPDIPAAALRAGATGTVDIEVMPNPDGTLLSASVIKSAGDTREHKLLDRVAIQHVIQCKNSLDTSKAKSLVTFKWILI